MFGGELVVLLCVPWYVEIRRDKCVVGDIVQFWVSGGVCALLSGVLCVVFYDICGGAED